MSKPDDPPPSVGLCAQLACIWEATARKPGNVHRYQDFEDVRYLDFIVSAAAIAPVMETARDRSVGETVLEAIRATRRVTATNTNLGIVLLLAPLACASAHSTGLSLQITLKAVLCSLDEADSVAVYEAIRLAVPGGLGRVAEQDVHDRPTMGLRQVMGLAADRDLIARQYDNWFEDIFLFGLSQLEHGLTLAGDLERAIIYCQLQLLKAFPDSLIQRKRGIDEAAEACDLARRVLAQAGRRRAGKSCATWTAGCGTRATSATPAPPRTS